MNRLKERRLELGLTQEAVSGILKLADPRMDVSMVSRFENGACLPTEEVMTALEAALRTSRAYLFGEDEKADIPPRTAETERIAGLIPKGRRNAISREDLAAALHTTDRKMRKAVAEAKMQGVMICNDGDGYYQSDELNDLWRQYRRETARAMSILKARKPMRDVLKAAGRPVWACLTTRSRVWNRSHTSCRGARCAAKKQIPCTRIFTARPWDAMCASERWTHGRKRNELEFVSH